MTTIATNLSQPLDVRCISLPHLHDLWSTHGRGWRWQCPFMTPPWLTAWWHCFGGEYDLLLLLLCRNEKPIGLAPLMMQERKAFFIGSTDLCDHGDFPISPGFEENFFSTLLLYLKKMDVHFLTLNPVRPDSMVQQALVPCAHSLGCEVLLEPQGVAVQMSLPDTWEEYLGSLKAKQRHEVRRKFRRLDEAGVLHCRIIKEGAAVRSVMDTFLRFFRESRQDKNNFMTQEREKFFRLLANGLAETDMLNLYLLEINNQPAASAFCIDDGNTTFLYNNGFDQRYQNISIGTVSKLVTIRKSIEAGKQIYDFLNGAESYKYRLGGEEVPLTRCTIHLKTMVHN